jgi:D-alanine--poly(phosphoribitol) ligase subunit 1
MFLLEKIRQQASEHPTRLAHVSGDAQLTYAELMQRADALAAYLARTLPDDASPLAVRGHKEPEMLIAFLGCAFARHPYIPLDRSVPEARVERILQTARVAEVLTPERVRALSQAPASPPPLAFSSADPYYIIFTSGSTGEPKGVVITRECLESFAQWMLAEQQFSADEIFLNQAPFSFDLSVMDLYLALVSGGTLFSLNSAQVASPKRLFPTLRESRVTTWVSTPSFAQMCVAEPTFNAALMPQVRRFLFCGETLTPELAAALLERFPQAQVWNTYGPTEATVATTSVQITRDILSKYAPLPVGYPKPDTKIVFLDDAEALTFNATRGEIVIAGPNVSPGYLHQPALTQRAFFTYDGLRAYRTGDAGYLQDGMLFFQGRLDLQIKLHGYRIELGDIEANLAALPGVRDAVVLPQLRDGRPDALVAFVIVNAANGKSNFEIELRLRAQLAERVPAYMVPTKFYFRETFPLTPNGKADRRHLAEQL